LSYRFFFSKYSALIFFTTILGFALLEESLWEILVWRDLALGSNNGATYLQIMSKVRQGHDRSRWAEVIDSRKTAYPVSIGWGGYDPMLTIRRYAWKAQAATHLQSFTVLPGRHFLQEDCAPQVAALIAENAANA
jgi:pimeloyl-ACP methyl ester carboxylesterase